MKIKIEELENEMLSPHRTVNPLENHEDAIWALKKIKALVYGVTEDVGLAERITDEKRIEMIDDFLYHLGIIGTNL